MTNGEMIQKVFDCEVCEPIIEDDIIHVIFADKKDSAIGFDWSWWNAEYKEPTTKNYSEVSSELDKNSKKLEKNIGESDCISRAYLLDDSKYHTVFNDDTGNFEDVVYREDIEKAPSVTPIRPKGHWINKSHRSGCGILFVASECTCCGKKTPFDCDEFLYRYCPNCGAKMDKENENG